ncbi:MAG: type IV pilus secretin PilQ [Bdellovibrio sp.]|nr:MAG: type IV pilus secretin PilQ [Bdellovibrio sp.]
MNQRLIKAVLMVLLVFNFLACSLNSKKGDRIDEEVASFAEEGVEGAEEGEAEEGNENADENEEDIVESDDVDNDEEDIAENDSDQVDEDEFDEEGNDEVTENDAEEKEEDLTAQNEEDSGAEDEEVQASSNKISEEDLEEENNEEHVEVKNIEYKANTQGGVIVVKTSGEASYTTRYKPDLKQFVLEIKNAFLNESLKRPYILKEFDGAFQGINAYQKPGSQIARIVVQLRSSQKPIVQREGNSFVIIPEKGLNLAESKPSSKPENQVTQKTTEEIQIAQDEKALSARSLEEFFASNMKFYGRPISIQTKDADVRDVIQFIADFSGSNIVISDDVKGKISLKLRQIPWDQALVIVMKTKGLGYIRQGNVLRISKLSLLQEEALAAKRIIDSQKGLTPLRVKVIPVNYAKVEDLKKQISPFLTRDRGKVVVDKRTSSVVITDTDEVIQRVSKLIKELDVPPEQVMIEAKVVEASEEFQKKFGINWSFGGGSLLSGSINSSLQVNSSNLKANPFSSLTVGAFPLVGDLSAKLIMAEKESMVKIISSPRIIAMNKEKAEIIQKTQVITVQETFDNDSNTTTTTSSSKDLTLRLTVTPQITSSGSVIMDVELLREFPGAIANSKTQDRPTNTRKATTKILVKNGDTAVIGGIYQSDTTRTDNGVPGLKDIPILGWLFKGRENSRVKNELLLFLTPRILKNQEAGS